MAQYRPGGILVVESEDSTRASVMQELQSYIPGAQIAEFRDAEEALMHLLDPAELTDSVGDEPVIIAGDGQEAMATGAFLESVGYRVAYALRPPKAIPYGGINALQERPPLLDVQPGREPIRVETLPVTSDSPDDLADVDACPVRDLPSEPMVETVRELFRTRRLLEARRVEICSLNLSLQELQSQHSQAIRRNRLLAGALALITTDQTLDDSRCGESGRAYSRILLELAASIRYELKRPVDAIVRCMRLFRRNLKNRARTTQALSSIELHSRILAATIRRLGTRSEDTSCDPIMTGELSPLTGQIQTGHREPAISLSNRPVQHNMTQRNGSPVSFGQTAASKDVRDADGATGTPLEAYRNQPFKGVRRNDPGCTVTVRRSKDVTPFQLVFPPFGEPPTDELVETVRAFLRTTQVLDDYSRYLIELLHVYLNLKRQYELIRMKNAYLSAEIFRTGGNGAP